MSKYLNRALGILILMLLFPVPNRAKVNDSISRFEFNRERLRIEKLIQSDEKITTEFNLKIEDAKRARLNLSRIMDTLGQDLRLEGINREKRIAYIGSQQTKLEKNLANQGLEGIKTTSNLDRFWVLLAAALVFLMQGGFTSLEIGMVRPKHIGGVAFKNLIDWVVVSVAFFLIGFGLMFGTDIWGVLGWDWLLTDSMSEYSNYLKNSLANTAEMSNALENAKRLGEPVPNGHFLGIEFFIYQLAFAATAATIVSGAMSERTALVPYIFTTLFISILIYPLFGHWVWGGAFLYDNAGWLENWGFRDFAGSTVVHSIGAWVALAGIQQIGPRTGRFLEDGGVDPDFEAPQNRGFAVLGVFILWFGWWGFNGGSTLKYNDSVGMIIMNTSLAGALGGIVAFWHSYWRDKKKNELRDTYSKAIGGVLGGLVAITACCAYVSSLEALIIGGIAGLVHNLAYDFLLKKNWDDPVGAVPVHGACGVWGTLCVAIFGDIDKIYGTSLPTWMASENETTKFISLCGIQILGIFVAFIFAYGLSRIFFWLLEKYYGLRVSPMEEWNGYTIGTGIGEEKEKSTEI